MIAETDERDMDVVFRNKPALQPQLPLEGDSLARQGAGDSALGQYGEEYPVVKMSLGLIPSAKHLAVLGGSQRRLPTHHYSRPGKLHPVEKYRT